MDMAPKTLKTVIQPGRFETTIKCGRIRKDRHWPQRLCARSAGMRERYDNPGFDLDLEC
jgi:hypothetical protein